MTAAEATQTTPVDPKPKFVTFDLYGTLTHFRMSDRTRALFSDRVPSGRMDEFLSDPHLRSRARTIGRSTSRVEAPWPPSSSADSSSCS